MKVAECPVDEELQRFAEDLFRTCVYVLGCGGGVIVEVQPRLAELKARYGEQELLRLALKLEFEAPPEARYPEGAGSAASGIICHLGGLALLQRFTARRRALIAQGVTAEEWALPQAENLIWGLSSRLNQPLPEGMTPLDEQSLYYLMK